MNQKRPFKKLRTFLLIFANLRVFNKLSKIKSFDQGENRMWRAWQFLPAIRIRLETCSTLVYVTFPNKMRPMVRMKSLPPKLIFTLMATYFSFFSLEEPWRKANYNRISHWRKNYDGNERIKQFELSTETSVMIIFKQIFDAPKKLRRWVLLLVNLAKSLFFLQRFLFPFKRRCLSHRFSWYSKAFISPLSIF